jgi:hypothetical protein
MKLRLPVVLFLFVLGGAAALLGELAARFGSASLHYP